MNDDLTRFHRLCFLHACGKLDGQDAAWMETMMAAHQDLRNAFDADLQLAGDARYALARQREDAPPLSNFHTVMNAVNARTQTPGALRWWLRLWQGSLPASWVTFGMAILAVFGAMQTVRLDGLRESPAGTQDYRSMRPASPPVLPMINITFRDAASSGAVRALLFHMKLEVVRGPDQQGVYTVSVREGSAKETLERLRASGLIADAYAVGTQR